MARGQQPLENDRTRSAEFALALSCRDALGMACASRPPGAPRPPLTLAIVGDVAFRAWFSQEATQPRPFIIRSAHSCGKAPCRSSLLLVKLVDDARHFSHRASRGCLVPTGMVRGAVTRLSETARGVVLRKVESLSQMLNQTFRWKGDRNEGCLGW